MKINKTSRISISFQGIFLCLGIVLSCISGITKAATHDFALSHNITVRNGLPANTVRHIAQDRYGFLWFGTDNGLCRYDGLSIIPYHIPHKGTTQYITALCPFHDGMLVGTESGAWFYDFHKGKFESLSLKANDGAVISTEISGFSIANDSTVWISTTMQGVFHYFDADNRLIHYKMKDRTASVFVDEDNQVWVLASSSYAPVLWLDRSRNAFVSAHLTNGNPAVSSNDYTSLTMLQTKDGTHWLGTWNNGLIKLAMPQNAIMSPSTPIVATQMADGPSLKHIHALYDLALDCVLIGSDEGLFSYNPQTGVMQPFAQSASISLPWESRGGSPRFIYDIIADSEGGVWTGSFYSGVNYLSEVPNRFRTFSQGTSSGLAGNVINHFCEDGQGRIWMASDDGGLNLFIPSTSTFADYSGREILGSLNVHALAIDGDELWVGTYSNGVYKRNISTGAIQHRESSSSDNSAYSILVDNNHNHWIGTMDGVLLIHELNDAPLLSKHFGALVIDIDEDAQGNIWCSTQGQGVWRYNAHKHQWKQFHIGEGSDADGYVNDEINGLCIDGSGNIYVAAHNAIYKYNRSNDSFDVVEFKENVGVITAVIEDQGVLWLSTSDGLLCYSPDKSLTHYGEGDGVLCGQFMSNAVMRSADGRLYFGSTQGFTCFYPYSIKSNKKLPPVYITRIEVFDKEVEGDDDRLSAALPFANKITLAHGDNMITLHFAALSYVSPSMNRYAYMLEGVDKGWNYTMGEGKAVYTNLSPGTYTFRVKAANNDATWSETETQLTIVVKPPFWWNPIAWILYLAIIVAGCYYAFRRYKQNQEERHQQELRELDIKKQAEVRDIRLKFYTTIAHEIRTPVSLIIGPLETLMEKIGDNPKAVITNDQRSTLSVIHRNASRLLELVNQLLDFNKIQQNQDMHFELCNIHKLIRGVTDRFLPALEQQNVTLTVSMPKEELQAIVDHEAITKVVSNLMTNARKYTRTKVILTLTVAEDTFCIIVEDDGMGINKNDINRIFAPFFQARNNKPGTGIGLSIVQNIVKTHHGNVNVESEEGKGTKFIVTLPRTQSSAPTEDEINGSDGITDSNAAKNALVSQANGSDIANESGASTAETGSNSAIMADMPGSGQSPILLIVEDDYDMLHFLADNFKEEYTVITAQNGAEGLRQLERNSVSLIISDWMMPEMDGREFCEHVRHNGDTSHIPFVMLTARTDNDSKAEGMNCGADAYIEKPFSMKYLKACIRNILDLRRLLFTKFSVTVSQPIGEVAQNPIDNDFLTKLNKLIEENVSNPDLNVNFLAQELGISRSGLFSKIKGITDATPNEMIQVIRLRHAATLLLSGQYRVSEVCYKVRFNNPSYFTKCFQKQFGVTPAKYAGSN